MSDLKQIEEKHGRAKHPYGTKVFCRECRRSYPCDVVKLARALDALLALQRGGPNAVGNWDDAFDEGERTLREVAGEKP